MRRNGRGASGSNGAATSADRDDCRLRLTRRRNRRCSTRRSTTASSDKLRMAFSAPASNMDPAIVGGLSPHTRETSRTRTTSRRPLGRPHGVWRTSRTLASVRDRFHRATVGPPDAPVDSLLLGRERVLYLPADVLVVLGQRFSLPRSGPGRARGRGSSETSR